jgi:hypothetical protein
MDPGPFASALAALNRAEVRYLVVGGVACVLNGLVRTTEDVDLLVEDFTDEEGAIRLVEDFPIDLFTRMGGRRYADMLRYRKESTGDVPIPCVAAEGLILLKSGSPRPQDQNDVEALRRLAGRA